MRTAQNTEPVQREQEEQKHREVTSRLRESGFSPDRAEELWNRLDQSKELDELIADAIAWAFKDNDAEVYGNNVEQKGAAEADRVRPDPEPDFDVPPPRGKDSSETEQPGYKEAQGASRQSAADVDEDEADDHEDEDLVFDLDDAAAQELYDAASAELNNPQTLAQNRCLLSALPEWLASLIREWMRFVKIPALLPTICALVSISAVLMRGLRCWGSRGWVFSNLYALLGAASGVGKSLVYDEAARPLEELDDELQSEFKELVSATRSELGIIESTIKAKMSEHQRALKAGEELSEAELRSFKAGLTSLHKEKDALEEQMKKYPSLWSSDFTGEVLSKRLQDNNEQLSLQSDEGGIAIFNIEGRYTEGRCTDDVLLCKCFSGNAHKVDRISREPISLKRPRCTLLLLVQPDLLRRVFRNERLIVGGFLARAFSVDCRLKMQPELPAGQAPINEELTAQWNKEIRALYHKFRCATEPYTIQVEEGARARARRHYNSIVSMVRHRLSDISSFAARWTEQTWRVALVLHAARYGTDCDKDALSERTYEAAASITRIFFLEQLKVLQALRVDHVHNTHTTLQELFLERQNAPITLRDLKRRHGLEKEEVETCIKTYPEIYELVTRRSAHGERSTVLFLKAFPPPGA